MKNTAIIIGKGSELQGGDGEPSGGCMLPIGSHSLTRLMAGIRMKVRIILVPSQRNIA